MRLRWTRLALQDFEDAYDYVACDSVDAARVIAKRIGDATRKLARYPLIGRPGLEPGTREWVVRRTRYLLVYEVTPDALSILRVWHMSKQRAESEDDSEGGAA
ncbi:MAG: type II toxin-antitoxin system RelE/ParE family toxin [Xanthomonadales bacterium]|nr:type II toxin-antitoxin system RelE/ParE family toxin [Xanthomonadales bacterium]